MTPESPRSFPVRSNPQWNGPGDRFGSPPASHIEQMNPQGQSSAPPPMNPAAQPPPNPAGEAEGLSPREAQIMRQQLPFPSGHERELIAQNAENNLKRMLYYRRQFDPRSLLFYRQYLSQQSSVKFPDNVTPRANSFIPYPYANVEANVSRLVDAFFSSRDWLAVFPKSRKWESSARVMHDVLIALLGKANVIDCMETCARNICIYGYGAVKVDWDWGCDMVSQITPASPPIMLPNGQPLPQQWKRELVPINRDCPRLYPIDVFDLLLDPDRRLAAHMVERSWGEIQQEYRANPSLYWPSGMQEIANQVAGTSDPNNTIVRLAELWDDVNRTVTMISFGEDYQSLSWKDERAAFRTGAVTPWKPKILGGRGVLLYHGPYPEFFPSMPIFFTSYTKLQGEVYGLGCVEIISTMVDALNRMVNMVTDNWNININKRYLINQDRDVDRESLKFLNSPGGLVNITGGDFANAIAPLPAFVPNPEDYNILKIYREMIEIASGVGSLQRGTEGSPSSSATLLQEAGFRFRQLVRNFEEDIMRPVLNFSAILIQQFLPDNAEIMITGADSAQLPKYPLISARDLMGSFDYQFAAADYAVNRQARQQNLKDLIAAVGDSPYINKYEAIKEIARTFEIRNPDLLLKTPEQVQQEQQQALQQQLALKHMENQQQTQQKIAIVEARGQGKIDSAEQKHQQRAQEYVLKQALKNAPPGEPSLDDQEMGAPAAPPQPSPQFGMPAFAQPQYPGNPEDEFPSGEQQS